MYHTRYHSKISSTNIERPELPLFTRESEHHLLVFHWQSSWAPRSTGLFFKKKFKFFRIFKFLPNRAINAHTNSPQRLPPTLLPTSPSWAAKFEEYDKPRLLLQFSYHSTLTNLNSSIRPSKTSCPASRSFMQHGFQIVGGLHKYGIQGKI